MLVLGADATTKGKYKRDDPGAKTEIAGGRKMRELFICWNERAAKSEQAAKNHYSGENSTIHMALHSILVGRKGVPECPLLPSGVEGNAAARFIDRISIPSSPIFKIIRLRPRARLPLVSGRDGHC